MTIFLRYLGNPEDGWAVRDEYTPAVPTVKSVNVDTESEMVWVGRDLKDHNPDYHGHHIITMVSMR